MSIHIIITTRREAFYWLVILFTFALGTATGDLLAETTNLGYLLFAIIFAVLIASVVISYFVFKVNVILAFWAHLSNSKKRRH